MYVEVPVYDNGCLIDLDLSHFCSSHMAVLSRWVYSECGRIPTRDLINESYHFLVILVFLCTSLNIWSYDFGFFQVFHHWCAFNIFFITTNLEKNKDFISRDQLNNNLFLVGFMWNTNLQLRLTITWSFVFTRIWMFRLNRYSNYNFFFPYS